MYKKSTILSLSVHNITFQNSLQQITSWGLENRSGFICFANVHMTIEAHRSTTFEQYLNEALLVLPDGKPLALACKWLHNNKQERISGMDFMPALLEMAERSGGKVFLYGSTPVVMDRLQQNIKEKHPKLQIAGAITPPFRDLTFEETQQHIDEINKSGANFVLVALGCPKQEVWMAQNYRKINGVLLGVGGAFPVLAGLQKRSPIVLQKLSMEWMYRLTQEPRRLFRRYTVTNSYFIALLSMAILRRKYSILISLTLHLQTLVEFIKEKSFRNF